MYKVGDRKIENGIEYVVVNIAEITTESGAKITTVTLAQVKL